MMSNKYSFFLFSYQNVAPTFYFDKRGLKLLWTGVLVSSTGIFAILYEGREVYNRFKCNCKVNGWEALPEIFDDSRGFPYKCVSLDAPKFMWLT